MPTPAPTLAPEPTPRATGLLVNEPEALDGYTLFTPEDSGLAYLIDNHGRVIHMWTLRHRPPLVKLLDNGNLLTSANRIFDADGNAVWNYRYPQHHDLLEMPNGNILSLSHVLILREEAVALGANPGSIACPALWATHIVEIRPTGPADGEIVWQWSALDHLIQDFDPKKPNYGVVADHPERIDINFTLAEARCKNDLRLDWHHANALDYNEDLDQVMITVRHFSEIWIIDHSTSAEEAAGRTSGNGGKGGDLLYRWGNPRAYQRGTLADQRLFWPHNAHWIPRGSPGAGNVLIFNNGSEYPGAERGYSSVDEISLPADGYNYRLDEGFAYGPNERIWRYAADPPDSFYAHGGSSAQRLPNGGTLITDLRAGRIFEVAREGKVVWDLVNPALIVYRAYRYAPDYPGLRGLDLTPRHQTAYRAAVASEPVARSVFDLHLTDGQLVYVKAECDQGDTGHRFFLHIVPERAVDLPPDRREHGFDNLTFDFFLNGALFDGKCVASAPLPEYSIVSIRTGQFVRGEGEVWSAMFWLNPERYRAAYRAAVASEPVARSVFDLHVTGGQLTYVKEECGQEDTANRFFLHITPERADDLPPERGEHGFDNLDFDFFLNGASFDGKCVASVSLPDYPIVSVRTGQRNQDKGDLWSAMFRLNPEPTARPTAPPRRASLLLAPYSICTSRTGDWCTSKKSAVRKTRGSGSLCISSRSGRTTCRRSGASPGSTTWTLISFSTARCSMGSASPRFRCRSTPSSPSERGSSAPMVNYGARSSRSAASRLLGNDDARIRDSLLRGTTGHGRKIPAFAGTAFRLGLTLVIGEGTRRAGK